MRIKIGTACAAALALWPVVTCAQPEVQPTFRASTSVVELAVAVTNSSGAPIEDLQQADFEVLEDGRPQRLTVFRRLRAAPGPSPKGPQGVQLRTVYSNQTDADAPLFVLLLDDLNTSPYDASRVIRAVGAALDAMPSDALIAMLTTSGVSGSLLTPERVNAQHRAVAQAFSGRLLLQTASGKGSGPQVTASAVNTPCTSGAGAESPDCLDPTRPARRAEALGAAASILGRAGARRKALFWFTSEAGASPLDPQGHVRRQREALVQALNGDVAIYVFDPRENAPTSQVDETRPDIRSGGRMRVGTADTVFSGAGGSVMTLNADDLAGVPLTQFARETGGRYVTAANDLGKFVADVIRQNATTYLLAYDSDVVASGRHALEVRVRRSGAQVNSRRGFVLPPQGVTPARSLAPLAQVLTGSVPQGRLPLNAHVEPEYQAGGARHVAVVVEIEKFDAAPVDVLVATVADAGQVLEQQQFRVQGPTPGGSWEVGTTLRADNGAVQVRVAAVSSGDETQSGLILAALPPGAQDPSALSAPVVRVAGTPEPTRNVVAGQTLSITAAAFGSAARESSGARVLLMNEAGVVREGAGTRVANGAGVALWKVQVEAPPPGDYWVVAESSTPNGRSEAIRLRVRAAARAPATSASDVDTRAEGRKEEVPADAALAFKVVSRGQATSGPSATFAVDSEGAWAELWARLGGSASRPAIDFDDATVFAVLLDEGGQVPQLTEVVQQGGEAVIRWQATRPDTRQAGAAHYVVVSVDQPVTGARFERVP